MYTQDEIDMILNRFKNNTTFTCAFLVACFTGMRTGEVCALTWDNIDLEKRIINIEHNVYSKVKDEKGKWFLGTPKTINGVRKVYICDTLLIALKNYKKKQENFKNVYGKRYHYYHLEEVKNKYGKTIEYRIVETVRKSKLLVTLDLVFRKENGVYSGTDIVKYPYKVVHNELGIENCRFYDLRGSYATKSLRNGVKIRNVADILGHSKIEATENYYVTTTEDSLKEASEKFEQTVQSDVIDEIIKYE